MITFNINYGCCLTLVASLKETRTCCVHR